MHARIFNSHTTQFKAPEITKVSIGTSEENFRLDVTFINTQGKTRISTLHFESIDNQSLIEAIQSLTGVNEEQAKQAAQNAWSENNLSNSPFINR
jgi:hypothetical protein